MSAAGEPTASRRAGDSKKGGGLVRSGDRHGAGEIFEFMRANQAEHRETTMCRVLGVSTRAGTTLGGVGVRRRGCVGMSSCRHASQRFTATHGAPMERRAFMRNWARMANGCA